MQEKKLSPVNLLTPQEHAFIGSTVKYKPRKPEDWYIPESVLLGEMTLEEAQRAREEMGDQKMNIFSALLGTNEGPIIMEVSSIDPKTGQTLRDPRVLGIWDSRKQEIADQEKAPGLTKRLYEALEKLGFNLHLRNQSVKEREGVSGVEGKL